ncbi:MAG: ATP-binding protein [Gammaproteobacteria bacterium]
MDDLFRSNAPPPGYRLQRLEVMNWGTFDSAHGALHTVCPQGRTSLLIGQNGSGKSTLADALLTLLVRPQTVSYNVAAGAHGRKRERNPASYIKGAFAHASAADNNRAQTRFLRPDGRHFTAILACFGNPGVERNFTLAQVLWLDSNQRAKRLCCFSNVELRAIDAFAELKSEGLRKQLQSRGFRVTDNFSQYEAWLRKETGMQAKAMDVFNQTVSVKDIQSLNEFIRRHMLESRPWNEHLDSILSHFDQLSEAHRLLVEAQRQLDALAPITELGEELRSLTTTLSEKQARRDASDAFFRLKTVELCTLARDEWKVELTQLESAISELDARLKATRERIRGLQNDLDGAASERLRRLPGLIEQARVMLRSAQQNHAQFRVCLRQAGAEQPVDTVQQFDEQRAWLKRQLPALQDELKSLDDQHVRLLSKKNDVDDDIRKLDLEVRDLQQRPTKLPRSQESMRRRLCHELGMEPRRLPFAAELISIHPHERAWEGVAELILRHFGLSLLVPDQHYRDVSRYVNSTRMTDDEDRGQRLVYLRIVAEDQAVELGRHREPEWRCLFHKLQVKPEHRLSDWVANELRQRADFLCCETLEEFQHTRYRAVTMERQIRFGTSRHEKDDRPKVSDPRFFILGWDNREKLRVLKEHLAAMVKKSEALAGDIKTAAAARERLRTRLAGTESALRYADFNAMDERSRARDIAELVKEKERLEQSSDRIRTLTRELRNAEAEESELDKAKTAKIEATGGVKAKIGEADKVVANAQTYLRECRESGQFERFEMLFEAIAGELVEHELTVFNVAPEASAYQSAQDAAIQQVRSQLDPVQKRVVAAMSRFLQEFSGIGVREGLEANPDYLDQFIAVHDRIRRDDLPQYESRFRERLRDKVLQEISLFQTKLVNEADEIREKIDVLNRSLEAIDYDEKLGTVMRLEPLPTRDQEIANFRQRLRDCTAGLFENTAQALEACYQRVERLIAELRSENTRWRDKVTDVREWFDFVARETIRETGEERNFHSDSQGQSGGEKAKLAFTILVAAVVYQFDINPDATRSNRFHFVVVDEMFSKVDDDYASYALRLFKQFGLQLLIVAPFDAKAKVTEPFVDFYLHVVKKDDRSQVFTMTSEEFRDRFVN